MPEPIPAIIWISVSTAPQATEDKESLPSQEAEARAVAERYGWPVLEVLRVTGHSRRYIDIYECNRDMLKAGVNAFDRLMWHWENTGRFVLIVRDGSRFSRTQSMHAFVTEKTIETGSNIYSLSDGMIGEHNYRMFTAMGGYSAAGEIDRLVKGREREMDKRVRVGLPTSSRVIMSHIPIHDPITHKVARIELNPALRRLWDDVAKVLLDGVSYHKMGIELYRRFAYVHPDTGRPYHRLLQTIMSPTFWGHSGRHLRVNSSGVEHWRMEEGHPIPDGVIMHYNTHEPVYKGELSEQVRAEIRRRSEIRGRMSPSKTKPFSGLFICDECKRHMQNFQDTRGHLRIKCMTHWADSDDRDCSQRKTVRYEKIYPYVTAIIQQMLDRNTTEIFSLPEETSVPADELAAEVDELRQRLESLILDKASARTASSRAIYSDLIEKDEERLEILEGALRETLHAQSRMLAEPRQMALREMDALGLPGFWLKDQRYQNQMLHRLFGPWRIVAREGTIVGATLKPLHYMIERKQNKRNDEMPE